MSQPPSHFLCGSTAEPPRNWAGCCGGFHYLQHCSSPKQQTLLPRRHLPNLPSARLLHCWPLGQGKLPSDDTSVRVRWQEQPQSLWTMTPGWAGRGRGATGFGFSLRGAGRPQPCPPHCRSRARSAAFSQRGTASDAASSRLSCSSVCQRSPLLWETCLKQPTPSAAGKGSAGGAVHGRVSPCVPAEGGHSLTQPPGRCCGWWGEAPSVLLAFPGQKVSCQRLPAPAGSEPHARRLALARAVPIFSISCTCRAASEAKGALGENSCRNCKQVFC